MAIRRRKFAKKRRSTFKRRVAKRRVAKRPALKRMIRREIARNVENKRAQYYNYDKRLYATGNVSFPTDNIFPVCVDPNAIVINQGVGQGQRVGNSIKTKKLVFKGTIVPFPYDATFNPQPLPMQGKMYIFYDKTEPTDVPNPQAASDFSRTETQLRAFRMILQTCGLQSIRIVTVFWQSDILRWDISNTLVQVLFPRRVIFQIMTSK